MADTRESPSGSLAASKWPTHLAGRFERRARFGSRHTLPAAANQRTHAEAGRDQKRDECGGERRQHTVLVLENVDAVLAIKSVESRHNFRQSKEIFLRQLQCPFVRMVMNTQERLGRLIELNVSTEHVTHGTIREEQRNTPRAREVRCRILDQEPPGKQEISGKEQAGGAIVVGDLGRIVSGSGYHVDGAASQIEGSGTIRPVG